MLPRGRVLRDEHAKDRYDVSCSAMLKGRAAHLQQDELAKLPNVVESFKKAKTVQRQKNKVMEDSVEDAECGVATEGAKVIGVSSLVEADFDGGGGGLLGRLLGSRQAKANGLHPKLFVLLAKHFPV